MANTQSALPASRTRFLTDSDVSRLADWRMAVDALASAYARPINDACVPQRSMARGEGIWLRSLTAAVPGGYMGCKLISASPRAGRASYLISLFDAQSMELSGLLDGNQITGLRTAATSALAIDYLAPQRPLRLAILGSGFEARALGSGARFAVRESKALKDEPGQPTKISDGHVVVGSNCLNELRIYRDLVLPQKQVR